MVSLIPWAGVRLAARADDIRAEPSSRQFDVRAFGARGDGVTLDTSAIQAALDAAGQAGGGQVRLPPGKYLSGTLHLRSRVAVALEAGATLIGSSRLADYQQPTVPDYLPEARWGKWHRGLIVGEQVEDVAILGPGTIDGQRVFDPTGEERMRGPHVMVLTGCRRFVVRDVTIVDAANYAIYFQVCDDVDIRHIKIVGGWDGVHWRGGPEHWCHNVTIQGCQFETGDDAIAGRYWENTLIADCTINSSCNGIRLIGPARQLIIHNNLFYGPGRRPHLTSREKQRNNMLSGILLQPGAWDATTGPLDDVLLSQNTMRQVASPVGLSVMPGNSLGQVVVAGLQATGVYRAPLSLENWSGMPGGQVTVRDAQIEYAGAGTAADAQKPVQRPGVDARPLPAWGLYARHLDRAVLEDVRLSLAATDLRPAILADAVGELRLDNVRYAAVPGVAEPVVAIEGTHVVRPDAPLQKQPGIEHQDRQ